MAQGVRLLEQVSILGLCREENGRVCGAWGRDEAGALRIRAGAVVLATGAQGAFFPSTSRRRPRPETAGLWPMRPGAGSSIWSFSRSVRRWSARGLPLLSTAICGGFCPAYSNRDGAEFLARYCQGGTTPEEALDRKAMSLSLSVRTDAQVVDIGIFPGNRPGPGHRRGRHMA